MNSRVDRFALPCLERLDAYMYMTTRTCRRIECLHVIVDGSLLLIFICSRVRTRNELLARAWNAPRAPPQHLGKSNRSWCESDCSQKRQNRKLVPALFVFTSKPHVNVYDPDNPCAPLYTVPCSRSLPTRRDGLLGKRPAI